MNRIYRKIALASLFFYFGSTAYVRFDEFDKICDPIMHVLYSLPWDVFPLNLFEGGKKYIPIQMGILSSPEVADLLETNPETSPHMHNGMILDQSVIRESLGEYLVIRFKYYGRCHFDIKYYIPCFPYSVNLDLNLRYDEGLYYNIILPHPRFLEKKCEDPGDISMRWKYFH